jgi:hypothetical protein
LRWVEQGKKDKNHDPGDRLGGQQSGEAQYHPFGLLALGEARHAPVAVNLRERGGGHDTQDKWSL